MWLEIRDESDSRRTLLTSGLLGGSAIAGKDHSDLVPEVIATDSDGSVMN